MLCGHCIPPSTTDACGRDSRGQVPPRTPVRGQSRRPVPCPPRRPPPPPPLTTSPGFLTKGQC